MAPGGVAAGEGASAHRRLIETYALTARLTNGEVVVEPDRGVIAELIHDLPSTLWMTLKAVVFDWKPTCSELAIVIDCLSPMR